MKKYYFDEDKLKKYIDGLFNQAPESLCSSFCWTPFINILNKYEFDDDTRIKIQNILSNET